MADTSFLSWPFFEPRHADWKRNVNAWATANIPKLVDHHDVDGS